MISCQKVHAQFVIDYEGRQIKLVGVYHPRYIYGQIKQSLDSTREKRKHNQFFWKHSWTHHLLK